MQPPELLITTDRLRDDCLLIAQMGDKPLVMSDDEFSSSASCIE